MISPLNRSDGLKELRQTLAISSETHRQAIDITPQVRDAIHGGEVHSGVVIANCLHTTCSVLVSEPRPALMEDLEQALGGLLFERASYKHNDPRLSDCERGNAVAHLRASLLGHGIAVGVLDGELLLDQSQSILLAEWDGPRARRIHVQIMGV